MKAKKRAQRALKRSAQVIGYEISHWLLFFFLRIAIEVSTKGDMTTYEGDASRDTRSLEGSEKLQRHLLPIFSQVTELAFSIPQ